MINTEFEVNGVTLRLNRYPARSQHKSLQAWDAADELIIHHIYENVSSLPTHSVLSIVILNDEFGAITCALAKLLSDFTLTLYHVTDSVISQKACKQNTEINDISATIQFINSMEKLPEEVSFVVMKVPRTLAYLESQLYRLSKVTINQQPLVAGAKLTQLPKAVFSLFERYLGTVTTSLAKKKSRLLFANGNQSTTPQGNNPTSFNVQAPGLPLPLTLVNHANVFSRQSLDIGARVMLTNMPPKTTDEVKIIDLGCGNGILGLAALSVSPNASVCFVDESYMAIASAMDSVKKNLKEKFSQCQFLTSNCLEDYSIEEFGQADIVLCNPPFHQQNTITEHIARQMFSDSYRVLRKGGELRIVANRHLPYGPMLKKRFGGFRVVVSDNKFVVLSAVKR